jgi:REP element-mobilizing transposase RayT
MPQSFTCLHYHLVFSTKSREPLIDANLQERLFEYMGGVLRDQRGKLLAAGGMPDHVHLLVSLDKQRGISETIRDLKANSSRWAHETFANQAGFAWQTGYGAFAVSYSNLDVVRDYLARQSEHHPARSFQDEFLELLRRHHIEFDERYMWD